jgi:Ca-activated chloride channel family protein
MKSRKLNTLGNLIICTAILWSSASLAAGLMTPADSALPQLEIRQHHVDIVIEDGYAITSIEQVFANPHSTDLEAIYSFPIPEKAAVGEFTFWIDGQPVTGEVFEKEKARKIYEEEKGAGRETALTEQDSHKTFDISVYPVRAQQDVRIKLTYIQPVHVDTAIGRYVYPLEEGGVDEQKLAFWTYNDEVKESFSFNLRFRSSYPVDQFRLPKHPQAQITRLSNLEWTVSLENTATGTEEEEGSSPDNMNPHRLDTDIVVYWRHAQGLPGSVELITYKEDTASRGTFMMTVTPGDDLAPIIEGRDWVFVLDFSGSMQGKYQSLVEGVSKGLTQLSPNERFRIILFNNGAHEITHSYEYATPENVQRYLTMLEQSSPNGGTNLYAGMKAGIDVLDDDRSSALILVTDGVANVGVTEKKRFLNLLESHDVRLFTFIMGNSANRPLLQSMAKVSNGTATSISNSDDIAGKILEATSKLTHEALHDIDVRFSGVKVKDLSPERIGSLYRGQQLIIFGHYWGAGEATITIDGKVSGTDKRYTTRFVFPESEMLHPEVERLWAYATIEDLQNQLDYFGADADVEQAIIDVAVNHGLVTDFTSMLVMREEQFVNRGIDRNNANRIAKEQSARQKRQNSTVRNNRADSRQPMFTNPAPTHNGGGALGLWTLLMLIPAIRYRVLKRQT